MKRASDPINILLGIWPRSLSALRQTTGPEKKHGLPENLVLPNATGQHLYSDAMTNVMNVLAPAIALGVPVLSQDARKAQNILNAASVVAAIPALHNLITRVVKTTSTYKSLPAIMRPIYLNKVIPHMAESVMLSVLPILMLQGTKYVISPKERRIEQGVMT